MNSHPCPSRNPATVSNAIAAIRAPDPTTTLRFRFSFRSSNSGAFSSVIVLVLRPHDPPQLDTESAWLEPADPPGRSPPAKRRRKDLELGSLPNQVDGNHVEPHRNGLSLRLGKSPEIGPGQAAQHLALILVHRRLRGTHVMRCPRLNFDKTQPVVIPRNQVHISAHSGARPAPRHHDMPAPLQLEHRSEEHT